MSGATFNLVELRKKLDGEDWEESPEDESIEVRRIYLGTVFSLTPSGKYYLPFACSNVAGDCKTCGGSGKLTPRVSRRRAKKIKAMLRLYGKRMLARLPQGWRLTASRLTSGRGYGDLSAHRAYFERYRTKRQALHDLIDRQCKRCDGTGSQSAADDERWREQTEEDLRSIDCYLESGEGDPCDLFACESRDKPDEAESAAGEATESRPA